MNNLFFFIGLFAVVVMLFTFDVSFVELWHHLTHAGYWLVPIIGVWVLVYAVNALSWRCIIRGGETEGSNDGKASGCESNGGKVSFLRIFRLTITGYALNYATPVGGLGGEPYRIMELSKNIDRDRAISSVILYAMMHIFAHFWFWFISIFIYLGLCAIGDLPMNLTVGIVLSLITVLCILAFWLFAKGYKNGIALKALRLVGKVPGLKGWSQRFISSHEETLRNIDTQIAALHQTDRRAFYQSLLLEYFSRIIQSLETMFMLLLFGIDCGGGFGGYLLTFLHSVLILAFTSLVANIIGFLPLQLGVQEGGYVLSIAAMSLSPAVGIFVSIISRVREMVWILIGVLLMKSKK